MDGNPDIIRQCDQIVASAGQERCKTFIALSTILTWGKTLKLGETFDEKSYTSRKPSPAFGVHKSLEDQLLHRSSEYCSVYIIGCGLLYGGAEDKLKPYFTDAWLCKSKSLIIPSLSGGTNFLPSIHVSDLARIVKYISQAQPPQRYIVAIDSFHTTVKDMIECIARKIGNNSVRLPEAEERDEFMLNENLSLFQVNMKFNLSNLAVNSFPVDWIAKSGFVSSFEAIKSEYLVINDLQPIRVVLMGPPASGKTYWSNYIATTYGLPKLSVKDCIEEAKTSNDPDISSLVTDGRIPVQSLAKIVRRSLSDTQKRNMGW